MIELSKLNSSYEVRRLGDPDAAEQIDEQFPDGMFRFENRMK